MTDRSTRAAERDLPAAGSWASARGIERVGDPRVSGSIIGAIGGSVFALANRGALDRPWPTVALLAWVVAIALYVWSTFLAVRRFPPLPAPRRGAGLVYIASVLGMLALIAGGSRLLQSQGRAELRVAVVVLAVGLHFLPFARAFHARVFALLGCLLAGLGVVGLVLGFTWTPVAAAAVAVVAGLAMLAILVASVLRPAGGGSGPAPSGR